MKHTKKNNGQNERIQEMVYLKTYTDSATDFSGVL
jgi:hypothetical protein